MVRAIKGVLIECDESVKQIILFLNSKEKVIIQDLDRTRLLVDASKLDYIKAELDKILEENTYSL